MMPTELQTSTSLTTPNTSRVLAKTCEDAMSLLDLPMELTEKVAQAHRREGETPEKALEGVRHWITKTVNYAVMAQGNDWVRQNRDRLASQLGLVSKAEQ